MTRLVIEIDGQETIVTDITPYRAERDEIIGKLSAIYEGFDKGPVSALYGREAEIVELLNRHALTQYVIESFEKESVRRANLLAGWELVKKHSAGGGT